MAQAKSPSAVRAGIRGVVTALVTPLTAEGGLDAPAMERLIGAQLSAGVDALFVLGSVGEGPLLRDEVAQRVLDCTAGCNGRRVPLLAGASDNSVDLCVGRLIRLAAHGIDCGVLTLPYYGWPELIDESVEFFTTVAARSPIPIVAYNLPKAVGWQMPVPMSERLFAIPNLICIKDTHDDIEQMAAVAGSLRRSTGVTYLPGNSAFAARLFRCGADGVVTTLANVFPRLFVSLWRRHLEGNVAAVDRIDTRVMPKLVELLGVLPSGAASIKGALEVLGVCRRFTVRPWPQAGDPELAKIRGLLNEVETRLAECDSTVGDSNHPHEGPRNTCQTRLNRCR
jgi:dihydrodipicolinate synthase/N-acetylneuraminate lyase